MRESNRCDVARHSRWPEHACVQVSRSALKLENLIKWGPTGLALAVNGVLKNIDLRGNSLGTEGWCAIFAALRDNKKNKIESWELSGQGINAEIAKVLAEYVSVSGVLKNINLRYNSLGDEGKGVIRDAVSGREGFELEM